MSSMSSERRRFFRINDTISLAYQMIDAQTAERGLAANALPVNDGHSLAATLDVLSQEALRVIQMLDASHAPIAELFKLLDAKINAVAQVVMFSGSNVDTQGTQHVNLSATGLAFEQSTELDVDQYLAIEMYLPAAVSLIRVYGRVVACQAVDDATNGVYRIRVDFTHIHEDDQELLIKHVVRQQWQQLQSTKSQSNPVG